MAEAQGLKVEVVTRAALDKLSGGTRHQGAAAYAPALRLLPLDQALEPVPGLALALDEVQDPQNFGAVVRSAVTLANAPVIFPEHASAPLTPATFRASAGAIEHARLIRVSSLRSSLSWLQGQGATVVALDGHSPTPLDEVDLTGPVVLVVGSEGYGLRKGVRAMATVVAHLPMSGRLDSLNASAAAAVALYESVRQRRKTAPAG
jgi:23S rRNA (guanosine2251-2'-O)-methyltransferase